MLKIAQVVSTFPPYYGGMGNVAYNYSVNLAARGHKVAVFTPDFNEDLEADLGNIANINVLRLKPRFSYGNAAYLRDLSKCLDDFDIVHLHYPFLGAESILKINKPLMLTYHMDLIGAGWKRPVFEIYQKIFLSRFLSKAAKVIFTSKDYLDNSRTAEFKINLSDKFAVIPLGVDDSFKPSVGDRVDFWKQFGVAEDKIVLFVGGLDRAHYFKGLNNLIKAMADFSDPEIALVVVGDGDLKVDYVNLANSLGLKKIYFIGRQKKGDLIKCYQNCQVLVLPSIDSSEAFGLVILEAFACGKPVIASALPGVRTLINPGVDGYLVKPGDITELSQAIKKLFQSDTAQMGRQALEKVEKFYRWPKIAEQIEKMYLEVLSSYYESGSNS